MIISQEHQLGPRLMSGTRNDLLTPGIILAIGITLANGKLHTIDQPLLFRSDRHDELSAMQESMTCSVEAITSSAAL